MCVCVWGGGCHLLLSYNSFAACDAGCGSSIVGSIPAVATRSLLVGSAETEVMVSPLCLAWQRIKMSDVSLVTRPRYSLVADEDVKKPNFKKARFG